MVPSPKTNADCPARAPERRTQWTATASGSTDAPSSKDSSSGSRCVFTPTVAFGMRTRSANAPGMPNPIPVSCICSQR